jgi:small-conductance mechanosensitive channel
LVKTEESQKEGSLFKDNRFFIEGEGNIKYSYNNGHIALDPLLASANFLKALEKIPSFIEKYQSDNQKLEKDLPVLKEVMDSVWKKEPELRELKSQLDTLSRQINLSLENKDKQQDIVGNQVTEQTQQTQKATIPEKKDIKPEATVQLPATGRQGQPETISNVRSGQPVSIREIVEANRDRIIITQSGTDVNRQEEVKKETDEEPDKALQPGKSRGFRM